MQTHFNIHISKLALGTAPYPGYDAVPHPAYACVGLTQLPLDKLMVVTVGWAVYVPSYINL